MVSLLKKQKMKKILIIDDEKDLCFLIKAHLRQKDNDVTVAYTLKDGLQKIDTLHPDVIFLDNNLPDGLGWEKACEISDVHPEIQINLMTGKPDYLFKNCDVEKRHFVIIDKPLSFEKVDSALLRA